MQCKSFRSLAALAALAITGAIAEPSVSAACPRGVSVTAVRQTYTYARVSPPALAVDAAPVMETRPGELLSIKGNFFGQETGVVKVYVENVTFDAEIKFWSAREVIIRVPQMSVARTVDARIDLHKADGVRAMSNRVRVPVGSPFRPVSEGDLEALVKSQPGPAEVASPLQEARVEVADPELPKVLAGKAIRIDGQFFGGERGSAQLQVGSVALEAEVVAWTANRVIVTLPHVDLDTPAAAKLTLFKASGDLAKTIDFQLTPDVEWRQLSSDVPQIGLSVK